MIGTAWLLVQLLLYNLGAWLLTYLIHSSIILALAWTVSRVLQPSPAWEVCLWRTAIVGGVLTASLRLVVGEMADGAWMVESAALMTGTFGVAGAILATLWLLLAPIRLHGWRRARRRLLGSIGSRRAHADDHLRAMSVEVARDLGLSGERIRFTRAPGILSPVAVGGGEVCLPEHGFENLDDSQQRSVLAHEIGHLAFRDPLWRMVGQLVRAGLFVQPLNRMAIRRMREVAEFRADDVAVRSAGTSLPLVEALWAFANRGRSASELDQTTGFVSLLERRVDRLFEGTPGGKAVPGRIRVAVVAVLLLGLAATVPGVDPPCDCRIRAALAGSSILPSSGPHLHDQSGDPLELPSVRRHHREVVGDARGGEP